MKLIMYAWGANSDDILIKNLKVIGHEIVVFEKKCNHFTRDMEFAGELVNLVHETKAQGIVSFNYFPVISLVCDVTGIEYYSWVYDCPHFTLYAKTIGLPCNHISVFDREMAEWFEKRGINTVKHFPLLVDEELFSSAKDGSEEKWRADVSFVGSMYTGQTNYFDDIFAQDEVALKIVDKACFDYSDSRTLQVDGAIMNRAIDGLKTKGLMLGEDYLQVPEEIALAAVFEKKITVLERDCLVRRLAGNSSLNFKLYTNSETDIKNCGTVDYYSQMPLVFRNSKINLNISLRSIHSGIPLRVLDIMACKGFVLTNYQPEITEYFKEGFEIVTFKTPEECMEKIEYYLAHEEERKTIAQNGYAAVKTRFSYETELKGLFDQF